MLVGDFFNATKVHSTHLVLSSSQNNPLLIDNGVSVSLWKRLILILRSRPWYIMYHAIYGISAFVIKGPHFLSGPGSRRLSPRRRLLQRALNSQGKLARRLIRLVDLRKYGGAGPENHVKGGQWPENGRIRDQPRLATVIYGTSCTVPKLHKERCRLQYVLRRAT